MSKKFFIRSDRSSSSNVRPSLSSLAWGRISVPTTSATNPSFPLWADHGLSMIHTYALFATHPFVDLEVVGCEEKGCSVQGDSGSLRLSTLPSLGRIKAGESEAEDGTKRRKIPFISGKQGRKQTEGQTGANPTFASGRPRPDEGGRRVKEGQGQEQITLGLRPRPRPRPVRGFDTRNGWHLTKRMRGPRPT